MTKTIHSANYADTQYFTASIMDIDEYIEEQMFFQEHKVLELFVSLCVGNALYPFVFVCWSITATWCLDRRSNLNKYLKLEMGGMPFFWPQSTIFEGNIFRMAARILKCKFFPTLPFKKWWHQNKSIKNCSPYFEPSYFNYLVSWFSILVHTSL